MIMLFKGNSSRLEHLIEKIQANKENHDVTPEDLKRKLVYIYFLLLYCLKKPLIICIMNFS